MFQTAARAYQIPRYSHQVESLSWWSLRGITRHTSVLSRLYGKNGSQTRFSSYQACKSLKIFWLATMERQRNDYTTDLQKIDLQKLKVRVTNFCKSVKCLYINELSAKNVKMSKMSVVLKSYTCVCAHTRVYTHTHHVRENYWHFDILTFLEFILLIFSVLIDLQKLQFLIFIFASPNFCKSELLSLIWENKIPWWSEKTEYLAFEGTKRLLGKILWRGELRAAAGKFGCNLEGLSIFLGIGFAHIGKKQ